MNAEPKLILVTGATGFIGRALRKRLLQEGYRLRATTRELAKAPARPHPQEQWVRCDLSFEGDLEGALRGVEVAYYLVHSMGKGERGFRELERRNAELFARVAARHRLQRIIYLGGVAPAGEPSEHLASRLEVGRILREGKVPTLELRASMVVGAGSASWQIVRDLAMRLPAMVFPRWTNSMTCPIALEDAVEALVRGLSLPLQKSAWFDLPGPQVLSGQALMLKVAALRGRRVPSLRVPLLTPYLSSLWLKLVTRADFSLAQELVAGFTHDLLPADGRYWELVGYSPKWTFEEAARKALEEERARPLPGFAANLEERLVERFGPKLKA